MIENRNIALYIVLSIITCGIFGFYWLYTLNEDINAVSNEPNPMSSALVIVLTIITCGIFGWYWLYKQGDNLDKVDGSSNSGIIYLVIGVFGLSIISWALMQDRLNKLSTNTPAN